MLKKVAFVLALTVLVSFALALESGPSNTVGFNKVTFDGNTVNGGYTPFGLAFTYWDVVAGVPSYGVESEKPSDIVGSQTTAGPPFLATEIICKNTGESGYLSPGGWTGPLEDNSSMIEGYCFLAWVKNANSEDVVFAGEVDTSTYAVGIPVPAGDSYTWVSFRDARQVNLANLNLVTSGFLGGVNPPTSDELLEKGTGLAAWYHNTAGWQGTIVGNQVTPGLAYMIHAIAGHGGYTYNYGPGAVAPPPERPDDNDGKINRITRPTRRSRSLR